jgi:general stress protein 26
MSDQKHGVMTISSLMRNLDLCMLTTRASDGALHSRPMSNNGEVEFGGDVWFFADSESRKVREIESDSRVSVSYAAAERGIWLALEGRATIVRDVEKKKELWLDELERWFHSGPEDDSVVLIKVSAERAEHWGKAGDGVVELA